ncbi:MAG: ion channel [Boseongicola sp.]
MKSGNFAWLLLALIVFLVGIPIADDFGVIGQPLVRTVAFSALLGIGVLSLKGSGRPFTLAMALVIAGITVNIAATHTPSFGLTYVSFVFIIGFLLIAVFFTFKQVATDIEISANRIIGAIAVYLLLGVLWAVAYTLVELTWPGSIKGFDVGGNSRWNSEWLYFSFVTMTTLGYGDIAPVSAIARALAYMQAVFGQFYIAILVAGLVGAFISHRDRQR